MLSRGCLHHPRCHQSRCHRTVAVAATAAVAAAVAEAFAAASAVFARPSPARSLFLRGRIGSVLNINSVG